MLSPVQQVSIACSAVVLKLKAAGSSPDSVYTVSVFQTPYRYVDHKSEVEAVFFCFGWWSVDGARKLLFVLVRFLEIWKCMTILMSSFQGL